MGVCYSCVFKACYRIYANTRVGRHLHSNYITRYKRIYGDRALHSHLTPFVFGELLIQPIPVLANNYTYMVADLIHKNFVLIDVGDLGQLGKQSVAPDAILTTHKHWDHSHGNRGLHALFPDVPIYGGEREKVPNATDKVHDGDVLRFGRLVFTAVWTPGHTKGHTCYFLDGCELNGPKSLFTGDHLMMACCGANFECNIRTMIQSLERLKAFPDETLVWPGHEMGLNSLHIAAFLEPENTVAMNKLVWALSRRGMMLCTCPSTLGEEKKYNPFLRTQDEVLIRNLGVKRTTLHCKQSVDPEEMGVACYKTIVAKALDESGSTMKKKKKVIKEALTRYMENEIMHERHPESVNPQIQVIVDSLLAKTT